MTGVRFYRDDTLTAILSAQLQAHVDSCFYWKLRAAFRGTMTSPLIGMWGQILWIP